MIRAAQLLATAVIGGLYAPTIVDLTRAWRFDTYSAHVAFVPIFSLLLAWTERGRIRASGRGGGHRAGVLLLGAALIVLALGTWSGSLFLRSLAIAPGVAGLVAALFGWPTLRAAAFPVAFLLFITPLPRAAVDAVTLSLQSFAASFATALLQLVDIPVHRNGIFLELPTVRLEVAEICNGLRFLSALVVLTTAFAQVTQHTPVRKLVLAVSAIPIAILANAMRVAVIAVATEYIGPEAASGATHHLLGKAVWAMTLVPLAGLGVVLAMTGPRPSRMTSPGPGSTGR